MDEKKTSAPLEWWQVIELATVRQLAALRQAGTIAATDARETVIVGRDGRSQPMRRYRDELHLPDHMRAVVR